MFELIPMNRRMPMNFRAMNDFEDMFRDSFKNMSAIFNTDIVDNENEIVLSADLPGFDKNNINIDVENDLLTISAERSEKEEEKNSNFVHKERYYGTVKRSFDLTGIDADKIEASYENGVLKIVLPKIKEVAPSKKTVAIK